MSEKKEEKSVVKKEEETTEVIVSSANANLFGAKEGENFLAKTFGATFGQVKKTLVEYKVEDIKREMKREIQDMIIELRRVARKPQDDLIKVMPQTPMQTINLSDINEKKFCEGLFNWGLECHKNAQKILNCIRIYQDMYGEEWDIEEKAYVKSLVINWETI